MNNIIDSLSFHLASLATCSAAIFRLRETYSLMPIILSGDSNTNFKKEESAPLIEYLREVFNLENTHDRNVPTTKYGTIIDAVFSTSIQKIKLKTLLAYCGYYEILITFINSETRGEDEFMDRIIEVDNDLII